MKSLVSRKDSLVTFELTNHYDAKAYLDVHLNWVRRPEKAKLVTGRDNIITNHYDAKGMFT
jgi:hypothetical protein